MKTAIGYAYAMFQSIAVLILLFPLVGYIIAATIAFINLILWFQFLPKDM